MSLLKVILISFAFGSTSSAPAAGTVLTTTGTQDSSGISSADATHPTATAARPTTANTTRFMVTLRRGFARITGTGRSIARRVAAVKVSHGAGVKKQRGGKVGN